MNSTKGKRTITYREAVKEAIREALQRDSRVFLMGEDVGHYGGCYAVSKGLLDEAGRAMLEREVTAEVEAAVAFAEAGTWEPVEELTRFVTSEGRAS